MWSFCFLLCSICVVSRVLSAPAESSSSTVRCYDCHYDPGALKQTDDGNWSGTGSGGFPRCALKNYDDPDFLNKYGCTKGKCFIRRDPNGQVFRGCADPWNLPWGVDTNSNCHKQNDKSVWWFCEGELCNDGGIDDDKRCEDLPKLEKEDKGPAYQQEEESYQHEEQNVYQPNYYQEDYGTEYKEPSPSISVTVEYKDDGSHPDSSSVSGYEAESSPSLPAETVYGNEYSDPKAWYDMYLSKFSNDPNTKPHYHNDDADFADLKDDKGKDVYNADINTNDVGYDNTNNNDNVYYSRTQGRYISYESGGPVHYYTDSELSYNTDRNYNTYDYVLPDDYGRTTEYNTVDEPVEPVPELHYPGTYEPEDDITVPVNDDYYPDNTETGYEDSEYKGNEATIDGGGYYGEDETYYSYDEPPPAPENTDGTENYARHIPENWYYRKEAELASHHLPHGWHPYLFPWFYGHHASSDSSAAAKDTEDTSYDRKISWNGQPYTPEVSKKQPTKNHYEEPKKSHEPAPKKSPYEAPKKSHPAPPKKSTYEPQKKSHEPPPKKSHYQPPKKSHEPAPKKSHYQPPKKSHEPAPKKFHYRPPMKSHEPTPNKSHYVPPKKSHDPPPKKSYQPQPKKSHDPPPKKNYQPPPKRSYEPPKKSHDPAPKKSYQPPPKKSHEPPKKSHDPPQNKNYQPPKKSYDPPPKKSHPPQKKSYEPPPKSQPPKGKYQPPAKSGPKKSVSPKKVFEPEESQPARSENTVYSLGDNLQVLGNTLIHVDDEHQDGVNAYVEVDHDNVDNYGREFDDNDAVYYEYEYELDPQTDGDANVVGYESNAGTGDLYDPNSLTDDTAYYYEYSHQYPAPSESVQNLCSGTCGLHPHPENNKQFVQCGPGVHYGQTCDCCQAYEHTCSDGTSFDAYIGVCSQGSDSSYDHASYKSVDYY